MLRCGGDIVLGIVTSCGSGDSSSCCLALFVAIDVRTVLVVRVVVALIIVIG
jgi:hypothetical protein